MSIAETRELGLEVRELVDQPVHPDDLLQIEAELVGGKGHYQRVLSAYPGHYQNTHTLCLDW